METVAAIVILDNALQSTSDDNMNGNIDTVMINNLIKCLEMAIASGEEEQAIESVKQLTKLKISLTIEEKKINRNETFSPLSIRLHRGLVKAKRPISDPGVTQSHAKRHQNRVARMNGEDDDIIDLEDGIFELTSTGMVVDEKIITDPIITIENDEIDELQVQPGANCNENVIIVDLHDDDDKKDENEMIERRKAKSITKKKYEEYNRLKELEGCELVPSFEKFECPVCLVEQEEMSGVVLRDCVHSFCRECIKQTVLMSTEVEIKCPYRDNDYSCKSTLRDSDIKALLDPVQYDQYLAKSVAHAECCAGNEAFHCQTPNCCGWCFHDRDVNAFLCPVCDKVNCLSCKAIHETQSCDDYQLSQDSNAQIERSRERLEEMVISGEAMYCPKCTIVITKIDGCDGFNCTKCGIAICWATRQARWGPKGFGDTSGGCRCSIGGRKCHPSCRNCH